jgi:hypothetical protein
VMSWKTRYWTYMSARMIAVMRDSRTSVAGYSCRQIRRASFL